MQLSEIKFQRSYINNYLTKARLKGLRALQSQPLLDFHQNFRPNMLKYSKVIKKYQISLLIDSKLSFSSEKLAKKIPYRLAKYVTSLELSIESLYGFQISLSQFSKIENLGVFFGLKNTPKTFHQSFKKAFTASRVIKTIKPIPFDGKILDMLRNHRRIKFIEIYQNTVREKVYDREKLMKLANNYENQIKFKISYSRIEQNFLEQNLPSSLENLKVMGFSSMTQRLLEYSPNYSFLKSLGILISSNKDLLLDFTKISNFTNLEKLAIQTNVRYSHLLTLEAFKDVKLPKLLKNIILELHISRESNLQEFKVSSFVESLNQLTHLETIALRVEVSKKIFTGTPSDDSEAIFLIETFLENITPNLKSLIIIDTTVETYKILQRSDSNNLLKLISKFTGMEKLSLRTGYNFVGNEVFEWAPSEIFINHCWNLIFNLNCHRLETLNLQAYLSPDNEKLYFDMMDLIMTWNSITNLSYSVYIHNPSSITKEKLLETIRELPKKLKNLKNLIILQQGMGLMNIEEFISTLDVRRTLKRMTINFMFIRIVRLQSGEFITLN